MMLDCGEATKCFENFGTVREGSIFLLYCKALSGIQFTIKAFVGLGKTWWTLLALFKINGCVTVLSTISWADLEGLDELTFDGG